MNRHINYYLLLLVFGCTSVFSAPVLESGSYWQCVVEDGANKQWVAKSMYQKTALNIAFASCKKESEKPLSCKSSIANCEGFNQGMSLKPMWRCTALDHTAEPWQSNFYRQRDDAALAAKAFCRNKSSLPESCYINIVTCVTFIEGVRM